MSKHYVYIWHWYNIICQLLLKNKFLKIILKICHGANVKIVSLSSSSKHFDPKDIIIIEMIFIVSLWKILVGETKKTSLRQSSTVQWPQIPPIPAKYPFTMGLCHTFHWGCIYFSTFLNLEWLSVLPLPIECGRNNGVWVLQGLTPSWNPALNLLWKKTDLAYWRMRGPV